MHIGVRTARRPRVPRRATAYPTVHTERDERAPQLRGETINNDVESFA